MSAREMAPCHKPSGDGPKKKKAVPKCESALKWKFRGPPRKKERVQIRKHARKAAQADTTWGRRGENVALG